MRNWFIEKVFGDDFVLINPKGPSILICDGEGRVIWELLKQADFDFASIRGNVEVPKEETRQFEEFLGYLHEFVNGDVQTKGIGQSLHQYYFEHQVPLVVGLEINQQCQLACKHCYNALNSSQARLPLFSIDRLGDDLAEMGAPYVIITGGEPLLHPDILAICKTLTAKGLAVKVFTNGYAMTEKIAEELSAMNIFLVGFTLFGHNAELHEYISGVPNSFVRICRAIKLMNENKVTVDVTFFLMQHNFDYRQEMFEWAKEEFGQAASYSVSITPCESGALTPLGLEIDRQQKIKLFTEMGIRYDPLVYGEHGTVPCTAGKTLCAVKYNGDVTPCVSLIHPVGSLHKQSFKEIWYNSTELKKFRALQLKDIDECNQCPRNKYCLRCYVSASFMNDLWGKDPHACEISAVIEIVSKSKTLEVKEAYPCKKG